MMIYITGVEGAGKSTICAELSKRGYLAIGFDESRLASRYLKGTWQLTDAQPSDSDATARWFTAREWKVNPKDLPAAAAERVQATGDQTVFFCGITDNFDELKDVFDRVVCLHLSVDQVKQRLVSRSNNDFGKRPAELAYILDKKTSYEEAAAATGAIMLDASQPLELLVNAIIEVSKSSS